MPRVNRELQRRLDARRERERRRIPGVQRQYQFSPATPGESQDLDQESYESDGIPAIEPATTIAARPLRAAAARPGTFRQGPRPFSEYRQEYAHVFGDLRRIVLVMGGLLMFLFALSFVVRG